MEIDIKKEDDIINPDPVQARIQRAHRRKEELERLGIRKHSYEYRRWFNQLGPEDRRDLINEMYWNQYLEILLIRLMIIGICSLVALGIYDHHVHPVDQLRSEFADANCTLNFALKPYIGRCDGKECVCLPLNFTVEQGKIWTTIFVMDGWKLDDAYNIERNKDKMFPPGMHHECYSNGETILLYIPGVESKRKTMTGFFWTAMVTSWTFLIDLCWRKWICERIKDHRVGI